jgi:hypothetical protein
VLALLCAGCGAPRPHELVITWTSDGNPQARPCNGAAVDCKAGFEVRDVTAGETHALPITATGYIANNALHPWAVRVVGYDVHGDPIQSSWATPQ